MNDGEREAQAPQGAAGGSRQQGQQESISQFPLLANEGEDWNSSQLLPQSKASKRNRPKIINYPDSESSDSNNYMDEGEKERPECGRATRQTQQQRLTRQLRGEESSSQGDGRMHLRNYQDRH